MAAGMRLREDGQARHILGHLGVARAAEAQHLGGGEKKCKIIRSTPLEKMFSTYALAGGIHNGKNRSVRRL